MHDYQERDEEKDRKARGKTRIKEICGKCSVGLKKEDVPDRTKWKNDVQNHSGDPR